MGALNQALKAGVNDSSSAVMKTVEIQTGTPAIACGACKFVMKLFRFPGI